MAGWTNQNPNVLRLESELIRKWRAAKGLTQEALGNACPTKLSHRSVAGYESRYTDETEGNTSAIALDNLLNVVIGLGVEGETPELKLARFFLGPEPSPSNGRLPAALAVAVEVAVGRGFTRDELAVRLGLSAVGLALLEGGVLPLSLDQFRTLCELSELSADEILKLPARLPLGVQERLREFHERARVFAESASALINEIDRLRTNGNDPH